MNNELLGVFIASSALLSTNIGKEILHISLMFDYRNLKKGDTPQQLPQLAFIKHNQLIDYFKSPE